MRTIFGSVRTPLTLLLLTALGSLSACTSTTEPPSTNGSVLQVDGALTPFELVPGETGAFTFTVIDMIVDGAIVRVDLVGENLEIDSGEETVSLDVALRNRSDVDLAAPARVVVSDLRPPEVEVINADGTITAGGFEFNYSDLLGPDGVLAAGETSGSRAWIFRDPGLVPFSFGASAHFASPPDPPRIAGVVFIDLNQNGEFDAVEELFRTGGVVSVVGPGLEVRAPLHRGRYEVPVRRPGLYTLTLHIPFLNPVPVPFPCFTTPNPLQVVLPAGPDGVAESFDDANFGVVLGGPCFDPEPIPIEPVMLTDTPPDSIGPQDPYDLISARLDGHILTLEVSFSGCSADQRFTLYASTHIMDSLPPQTRAFLVHEAGGQLCPAVLKRTLRFDLSPILGLLDPPQPIIVRFSDFHGEEHRFLLEPRLGFPGHEATD